MTSDQVALERWIRGRDAEAFAELVSRYAGMVYATCLRVLGNATEAEDAAQECFVELAGQGKVVGPSLGGWLHQVAVFHSLSRVRTEQRRRNRERRFAEQAGVGSEAPWDEIKPHLDEAIAGLPAKFRLAVVQHFLEGRTQEAVARDFNITQSTVHYRIVQGVERIRRFLRRRGIETSAGALAALMGTETAVAAPATLVALLGEHAIVGYVPAATAVAAKLAFTGGIVMTKKIVVGVAVVLLAFGAAFLASPLNPWASRNTQPASSHASGQPAAARHADTGKDVSNANAAPLSESKETASAGGVSESDGTGAKTADPDTGQGVGARQGENIPETGKDVSASGPPATIAGLVQNDEAWPIPDAHVWVEVVDAAGTATARFDGQTGQDGRYAISGITAFGPARICADAKGHIMESRGLAAIQSGESRGDVDFTLTRAAFLVKGVVVAKDEQPVPGAEVSLVETQELPGAGNERWSTSMSPREIFTPEFQPLFIH